MYSSGDSKVSFGGEGDPSDDGSATGLAAPDLGCSESNSPIGEVCIKAPVPLGSCNKEPPVVYHNVRNAASAIAWAVHPMIMPQLPRPVAGSLYTNS
jgi:hypothetical protein